MDRKPEFAAGDVERIGRWLRQLEVTRRQCHLYDPNHPATEPAKRELWRTTQALPETLALVKITKHGFELPGIELQGAAAGSERLAGQLSDLGIVAVGVRPPIEWPDANGFVTIAADLKERPSEEDRVEFLERSSALGTITLIPIDVDWYLFSEGLAATAALGETGLWPALVSGLIGSGTGVVSPTEVARAVEDSGDSRRMIDTMIVQTVELLEEAELEGEFLDGLILLVAVEKVITGMGAANQRHAIRKILPLADSSSKLRMRLADIVPPKLLVEGVRWLLDERQPVTERVGERIEEIAESGGVGPRSGRSTGLVVSADTLRKARALRDILKPKVVDDGASAPPSASAFHRSDRLRGLCSDPKLASEISEAFGDHALRRHSELILLSIPSVWPDSTFARTAEQQLVLRYFQRVEFGEFKQAAVIVRDLESVASGSRVIDLAGTAGLDALLNALEEWGKEHREEVAEVAVLIGVRLIPTILAALESEDQMSRRRRLLEMALAIGKPALPYVHAKLVDEPWYVIRNAVFLMRRIGDPELSEKLSGLIDHREPRVAAEVITALAGVGDARWAPAFVKLFDRKDEGARREALAVASRLKHPELGRFLVKRLSKRGVLSIREADTLDMIDVLGNYSQAETYEELYRLASLPSWRYPFRLTPVWEAVAKAAVRLPSPEGDRILSKVASQKDPAADLASELLARRATESK
jgi:hypothetical protein